MVFQSLHKKIAKMFVAVGLSCFVITAVLMSYFKYQDVRQEKAKIMLTRIEVAKAVVADALLSTDDMVEWLSWKKNLDFNETIFSSLASSRYFELHGDSFYILDTQGRVVLISEPYDDYFGLDFSSMVSPVKGDNVQVIHQHSLLTNEPVVTLQYPIEDGDLLVVERNLASIIPIMLSLVAGEFFEGELFFVLAEDGKAIYHPDLSLVRSRHNIGFDMKDSTEVAEDGVFGFSYLAKRYLAVSLQFDSPEGWQVYYAIPQGVFLKEIKDALIPQLILLFLAFLVIFLTLRYFISIFFSEPISQIVAVLTEEKRDDEFLIPGKLARGVEEFGTIIQVINSRDQQLSRTLERFQSVLDSIDSLVYVADMQTYELLFINKFGKEIFGDCVGQKCYASLQSGQDTPCDFCTNAHLLDDQGHAKDVYVWEFQNTIDKEWYECRDQAIRWTDGHLVRMEIATNISARKQWESALLQEKERLAVTLRSIGDGVITADVDGNVVLVNRVAEALTGWSQADATGQHVTAVFNIANKNTSQPCTNPVQRIYEHGEILALERGVELIARDGTRRIINDSGAPIRGQDSKVIGAVLVFRDVTDELNQEEELQKARKLKSVGVLAGGIAHDFNNLLSAILGNLSLAQEYIQPGDQAYDLLKEAEKASERATNLTQQLLTFSKGGAPVKQVASVENLIRDSANFVLSGANVSCTYDFADNLYDVDVDVGQIGQVIQNLVINAKQAMVHGGIISIHCSNVVQSATTESLQAGHYVKVDVRDEGEGISPAIIGNVFDPYFTTKDDGSGLGLAVCHSIIQKHGGIIQVSSTPAAGTEFTLHLPGVVGEKDAIAVDEKVVALAGGRVLVMDDESVVRKVAAGMLEFLGYETFEAENGEEAIALVEKYYATDAAIDAIIMDLTIPGGMGGEEAVTQVLKIDPRVKVIVASGYSNDPILANCQDYGFMAPLVKPFSMKDLSTVMAKVFL